MKGMALDSDIHIWKLWLPAASNQISAAASLLIAGESERANRYLHEKNKQRFILSRAMLRSIVSKYTGAKPAEVVFSTTGNKKPCVAGSDLQFNVSHSGDMVLIAIADIPIGIDVERVDDHFDFSEVLPVCFCREESDMVERHGKEYFYRYWTRKEALVKASGSGLDSSMQLLPCMDGVHEMLPGIAGLEGDWVVNNFVAEAGYVSCIAYPSLDKRLKGFDISNSLADLLGA